MRQMWCKSSFRRTGYARRRNQMHRLWVQDFEESEAACRETYSCQIEGEKREKINSAVNSAELLSGRRVL